MSNLSSLIAIEIKRRKSTPAAMAKDLGLAYPSFLAVLAGKSVPNARSLPKYAKLVGMKVEKVIAIAGSRKWGSKKGKKTVSVGRVGRGPGRPKLPGVAKATVRLLSDTLASVQKKMDRMAKVIDGLR